MNRRTFHFCALVAGAALALGGCVSHTPTDLALSSVRLVNYRTEKEVPPPSASLAIMVGVRNLPKLGLSMHAPKPDRALLRIEFSSSVNLPRFAFRNDYTLASRAYFCDAPGGGTWEAGTIGMPDIYSHGALLTPYDPNPIDADAQAAAPFTYYGYVAVASIVVRYEFEKEKEFYDLRRTPRDVCMFVRGGKAFSTFESNRIVIPKETIVEVLRGSAKH